MSNDTRMVSEKTRFDLERLGSYLRRTLKGYDGPLGVREFSGGGSNPTFLLVTPTQNYVLRRRPQGPLVKSAHAIDREFRIIGALHPTGYAVPRPLLYCDDISIIGGEFYLMEHISGRIFLDYALPRLAPAERHAVYDSMNVAIARLHCIDYRAVGLSDYGRPGNYFERQIALWKRQYEQSQKKIDEFESLARWLADNVIRDELTSVVHGDFTLLNCIFGSDGPRISAVLDWELSTIGHPLADFAYNLSHWYLPNLRAHLGYGTLVGKDVAALGIPTLEEYSRLYASRVNFEIKDRDLNFAIAFSLFRLAGIAVGAAARVHAGTAKNEIADSAEDHIGPNIRLAWSFARRADAS